MIILENNELRVFPHETKPLIRSELFKSMLYETIYYSTLTSLFFFEYHQDSIEFGCYALTLKPKYTFNFQIESV